MKRTIAIFSLIVMFITAIKPIIAMHYCGDILHSFNLYQINRATESCCDDNDHSDGLDSNDKCCETELLKLSTDEFQYKIEQINSRVLSSISLESIGVVLGNILNKTLQEFNTSQTTFKFPTKGHYLKDVSILTYICIYRI